MSDAFYRKRDGAFVSTEHTRGPWNPEHQHAGPPSALLARALERCSPRDDARIARVTTEILKPVPIAPLELEASVVRPGRSVEMLEATVLAGDEPVMRARAWRIRKTALGVATEPDAPRLPSPEDGSDQPYFPTEATVGYHTSMEWRFLRGGGFRKPGPATAWLRMNLPLVEEEEPSALSRVLIAADSGHGISPPLDYESYIFVNTDLTVQLYRDPEGEWIGLDARSHVEPTGVGITHSVLHDRSGAVGRALQTLFVAAR